MHSRQVDAISKQFVAPELCVSREILLLDDAGADSDPDTPASASASLHGHSHNGTLFVQAMEAEESTAQRYLLSKTSSISL